MDPEAAAAGDDGSGLDVGAEVSRLLRERASNADILTVLEAVPAPVKSTPAFVKSLVQAVVADADDTVMKRSKIPEKIKARQPLLRPFLDNRKDLQLHAVCAVQDLAESRKFPKGASGRAWPCFVDCARFPEPAVFNPSLGVWCAVDFVHYAFEALYDEDLVVEAAFMAWRDDEGVSRSDYKGKNVTLTQAKEFMARLEQGEEEPDQEAQ